MQTSQQKTLAAAMMYYGVIVKSIEDEIFRWSRVRKRFTLDKANAFFVGVMLDQGQLAERAWDGGRHLVETHFTGRRGFWKEVLTAHQQTVNRICTTGYDGKSYASAYCTNKFPLWLRSAAKLMVFKYHGDPREIWAGIAPKRAGVIYDRFREFDGIGDALAKMAQFILVRNHRVAGGQQIQQRMSVKPDALVRRVLARTGIVESERTSMVVRRLTALNLRRPVDLDASLWVVGRKFCFKTDPDCGSCPLRRACAYA